MREVVRDETRDAAAAELIKDVALPSRRAASESDL
jgi:hypothetical protein